VNTKRTGLIAKTDYRLQAYFCLDFFDPFKWYKTGCLKTDLTKQTFGKQQGLLHK
jgi:hypothetical protein